MKHVHLGKAALLTMALIGFLLAPVAAESVFSGPMLVLALVLGAFAFLPLVIVLTFREDD